MLVCGLLPRRFSSWCSLHTYVIIASGVRLLSRLKDTNNWTVLCMSFLGAWRLYKCARLNAIDHRSTLKLEKSAILDAVQNAKS